MKTSALRCRPSTTEVFMVDVDHWAFQLVDADRPWKPQFSALPANYSYLIKEGIKDLFLIKLIEKNLLALFGGPLFAVTVLLVDVDHPDVFLLVDVDHPDVFLLVDVDHWAILLVDVDHRAFLVDIGRRLSTAIFTNVFITPKL